MNAVLPGAEEPPRKRKKQKKQNDPSRCEVTDCTPSAPPARRFPIPRQGVGMGGVAAPRFFCTETLIAVARTTVSSSRRRGPALAKTHRRPKDRWMAENTRRAAGALPS